MNKKTTIATVVALIVLAYFLIPMLLNKNQLRNQLSPITNENNQPMSMQLTSPAFRDGEFIPSKYTCDEAAPKGAYGYNPPLKISGVKAGTKSLVLIMDDPDVPKQIRPEGYFDHWVVYGIPADATYFGEGAFYGTQGLNGAGKASYTGPCPPTQYQPTTHRYFFKLYATDIENLNFTKAPTKQEILTAIEGHIIGEAILMGRYDRTKTSAQDN